MKQNFIDTEFVQMWFEDDIIYAVFKPKLVINLELAKSIVAERLKISNGIARPVLVDVSGIASIDIHSRKYFASEEATQFVKAGAFVVNGLIPRFAAQIFMKIDKPLITSRVFRNAEKAKRWLEKYK